MTKLQCIKIFKIQPKSLFNWNLEFNPMLKDNNINVFSDVSLTHKRRREARFFY